MHQIELQLHFHEVADTANQQSMQIPDDFPTPHTHSAFPAIIQMVVGGLDEPVDWGARVQQVYLRFPPEPVLSAGGHVVTHQLQPD